MGDAHDVRLYGLSDDLSRWGFHSSSSNVHTHRIVTQQRDPARSWCPARSPTVTRAHAISILTSISEHDELYRASSSISDSSRP